MSRNTGIRYTEELWDLFFEEIVELGIPPTGKVALQWFYDKTGNNISKSTIQNRVNPVSRANNNERTIKNRSDNIKVILSKKIGQFCLPHITTTKKEAERRRDWLFHFKNKITRFSIAGTNLSKRYENMNFSSEELIESWKENYELNLEEKTVNCYLTGDKIDLTKTGSYHLDHIIPKSRGGSNTIENCGPATKEANQAKNSLTEEEFLDLCKKVIKYKTQ